jgi:UDP-N-acetylmuramoylalanine-D-glutamate ligase
MGEVEMASRWLKGRVIAITGTKGKSTDHAHRADAAGGRTGRAGRRISAALSTRRSVATRDRPRGRGEQQPRGD